MFWKVLGSILLIKYGISLTQFLYLMLRLYVLPKFGLRLDLKKYGKWAVVTGATDGIGKAIAKELAKRGLNLVLISRTEAKLQSVADELGTDVQVKTIAFDFSRTRGYEAISAELKDLDIGLLVNNVGMSYDHPDFYLNYPKEYFEDMVNINVKSVMELSQAVLEGMVQRKRGILVHISSSSSLIPVPFLSVYSGAKAFVTFFGQAIGLEYEKQGIISQVVTPSFVATKMSKARPNGTTIPSAESFAKQMVNAIGLSPCMAGFWSHEILTYLQMLLPQFLIKKQVFKLMDGHRRRWLRKQQQKKE